MLGKRYPQVLYQSDSFCSEQARSLQALGRDLSETLYIDGEITAMVLSYCYK